MQSNEPSISQQMAAEIKAQCFTDFKPDEKLQRACVKKESFSDQINSYEVKSDFKFKQ